MIQKLFPNGKTKAFNITYDDGVLQDVRFVELLNRYGLKGTFNLNFGLMQNEFEWIHENGMTVKRLSMQVAASLYDGHEVASHTLTHPYMENLTEVEIMREMVEDKHGLEELFHREIAGFAVPFLHYSDLIAHCARNSGFEYARISEESNTYAIPTDPYWWKAGKFHWSDDLEDYVESFLASNEEMAFCQIVGHSYDLDVWNMWGRMEAIFAKISAAENVLPMTNLEVARYVRAMEKAEISEEVVKNNSEMHLWFLIDGEVKVLQPGESIIRKDEWK